MKTTKLLTSAAVAALATAGAANAQISIFQGPTQAPDLSGTPFGTGNLVFASEIDLDGVTVPLEFDVGVATATQTWATSANVEGLLTITFSGGVLDRSLDDDDIEPAGGVGTCSDGLLSVDYDGAAGQNTVTFRIADLQVCDDENNNLDGDNNFVFAFPVILDGTPVNIEAELVRASNNDPIASGEWSSDNNGAPATAPLISQASALSVSSVAGTATVNTALSFTTFGDSSLGFVSLNTTGVLLADGTPVAGADVDDAELFCTFENVTGLEQDAHSFGGFTNDATADTTNPVPFSATVPTSGTLFLTSLGTAPIQSQRVNCNGTVAWDTATGLSDTSIPSFLIGTIRREGVESGIFEWTGDASAVTRSVFRITGLGATAPSASVIITNSTNGMDGEYALTIPTPSNGEAIISNATIASAVGGAFGRADVQISLKDNALGNVVIRRLLVGSNGTLFDLGDENDDDDQNAPNPQQAVDGLGGGDNP